jgi:uncharacterized membrane protein
MPQGTNRISMKKHARTLILLLAAAGLAASIASLYVHYRLIADPTYTSFCDVSATVSCETVMTSRFGYLFGVPVAVGGAIWSAAVLLLGVFGMRPTGSEKAGRVAGYIFVLSTVGLAAVLYLGYASFFVLRQMCPLCLTMYAAVIGLFVVSGAAASDLSVLPRRVGRDVQDVLSGPASAAAAGALLVAAVGLILWFPAEQRASATVISDAPAPTEVLGAEETAQFEAWLAMQPRADLGIPANGARVVVAKFNDFQCPACRQAYVAYRSIEEKYERDYPGQVAFVNVDYPLESECNTGGIHGAACEAAVAVRLARERNRHKEMEAWLFDNQSTLTRDTVKAALADIAQVDDFDAKYATVLNEVRSDAQLGQKLQINGTPTFFINGIRIASTLRPSYFDAAIAYELKRTQPATQ